MNAIENGFESSPLTTRIAVVNRVAAGWLESHPEIAVTTDNLAKTLQQILTEVFLTGRQRCRRSLSGYAVSLMQAAAVDPKEVASARTFSQSADLPARYTRIFTELATLLAPLAAAVQLSRSAVADAAFALVNSSGNPLGITRLGLRGYVESRVCQHALRIHEGSGYGQAAHVYLQRLLEDVDELAAAVVRAATDKACQSGRLSDRSRASFEEFIDAYGARLWAESKKYGSAAEEIHSRALEKMAVAYRNNPSLDAGFAYAKTVLKNAWNSHNEKKSGRSEVLLENFERANVPEPVHPDHGDQSTVIDTIVRRLLGVAESLQSSTSTEATQASELLINYFFVDPTRRCDPHQAELAERVWELTDTTNGAELEKGLRELAKELFSTPASAAQIAKMVIKALRHYKGGLS